MPLEISVSKPLESKKFVAIQSWLLLPACILLITIWNGIDLNPAKVSRIILRTSSIERQNGRIDVYNQYVLVVITGLWGSNDTIYTNRVSFLLDQIEAYRLACEKGLDITIYLATYEGNKATAPQVPKKSKFCQRIGSNIMVRDAFFKHSRLPDGYFGTAGTLQFDHRKIFESNIKKFHIFISQEDDVLVTYDHIAYFQKWNSRLNSSHIPGFGSFDIAPCNLSFITKGICNDNTALKMIYRKHLIGNAAMITWRWNAFILYYVGHYLIASTKSSMMGRMYMIDRARLENIIDERWATVIPNKSGRIEFNPYFGTTQWMSEYKYKIVIPWEDVFHSLVYHMSNRYIGRSISTAEKQIQQNGTELPSESPFTVISDAEFEHVHDGARFIFETVKLGLHANQTKDIAVDYSVIKWVSDVPYHCSKSETVTGMQFSVQKHYQFSPNDMVIKFKCF